MAAIGTAGNRILFEPSRRDQCAQDWPASSDNEILSVAVFHALNHVVLVSEDRNLRNKAQAESLMAMNVAQYLAASRPGQPAPRSPKHRTPTETAR